MKTVSSRMAFKFSVYCTLVWIIISVGFAAGIELGDDIENFVPTCAQSCLKSFIIGNYPSSDCTANPTLQCLCSEQSNSGYTLGEGALQCITVEEQRGGCDENTVGGSVKHDSYLMCSKIANALPNTHSVLTATIADSPTGDSASIVLPAMPTGTETTQTSLPTPIATSTGSLATITSSAAPSPAASQTPSLNGAQVAGIVVGIAGALLITLIAILIGKRIRRRNFPDLENGLRSIDEDGRKSGASGSRPDGPLVISAPFRRISIHHLDPRPYRTPPPQFPGLPVNPRTPPIPSPPPNPFLSPNPNQEDVGLAISRSQNTTPSASPEVPVHRPRSRLLPAKPALSVKIPPPQPPPPPGPLSRPRAAVTRTVSSRTTRTDRASIITAFADIDTEITEGVQVLRPPINNSHSETPLYFDDERGNWVLNNTNPQFDLARVTEVAELDTYTPMTKSPIERKEEQERRKEQAVAMAAAISAASALPKRLQPAFLSIDHTEATLNRSSSVYSQASAIRHNPRVFSRIRSSSRSRSRSRRGNGAQLARSDTVLSHDSVTTINTCSTSPFEEEVPFELDDARLSQLSTVIESRSATPVKYPKFSGHLKRTVVQINSSKRLDSASSPAGQPSPTLKGAALPPNDNRSLYPQPLNAKRIQGSEAPRNSDVEVDLPRPPRFDESRPPIQSPLSRFAQLAPNAEVRNPKSSYPERLQTPPPHTSQSGFSPNHPTIEKFTTPSPLSSRSGNGETHSHVARAVSPLSLKVLNSGTKGASSLLAKRVGNGKAEALALNSSNKKKERWQRQRDQVSMRSPDDAGLSSAKGSLPHTPTWQPKLTPTRHGDDLYLNVQ
ncbi:hypothetical protein F5Y06DRAFT_43959 [Hypoxylon sp. FL0890]|nr:hypothetical protein F5Y06DRAFT_43959 [Hypoxylon sp. FL0890]